MAEYNVYPNAVPTQNFKPPDNAILRQRLLELFEENLGNRPEPPGQTTLAVGYTRVSSDMQLDGTSAVEKTHPRGAGAGACGGPH